MNVLLTFALLLGLQLPDSALLFKVTLKAPPTPLKLGTEIRLSAKITNISDHDIRFARSFGPAADDYQIEVRDGEGQTPPLSETGRQLKLHPNARWGSYSSYDLAPNKSFDDELKLSSVYAITRPGTYTVWVVRARRPMWQVPETEGIRSNTIALTISK